MPIAGPLYGTKLGSGGYTVETTAAKCKAYANSIRASQPARAAIWDYFASQPAPLWLAGDWGAAHGPSGVDAHLAAAAVAGTVPIFVLYYIPNRDNGSESGQDEPVTSAMFRGFVDAIAAAIGNDRCIVWVEPDASSSCYKLTGGVNGGPATARKADLAYALAKLRSACPNARIYLDAGDNKFRPKAEMAAILAECDVHLAHGIGLNCAHVESIEDEYAYYLGIKALCPGVGSVGIATERSGSGHYTAHAGDRSNVAYYNPPARGFLDGTGGKPNRPTEGCALGPEPTCDFDATGVPGLDFLAWVKFPGGSDASHPRAGAAPEFPAVDAPDPGDLYPSYWEALYAARQGLDLSRWAPVTIPPPAHRPARNRNHHRRRRS